MQLNSLNDLYLEHIQDLRSAEQQIIEALPKMIDKASHQNLRDGFSRHLEQTRQHAHRLDEIVQRLGKNVGDKTCKGMEGLLKEGSEVLKDDGDADVIDAALIAAAQRVEHYEMAAYGCARTYAAALGRDQDAALLQRTLDEEGQTDKSLTQLAESIVNPDAQKAIGVERDTGVRTERSRSSRDTDREVRP